MAVVDGGTGELTSATVVEGLGALAHETRLAIFRHLVQRGPEGESAGELARRVEVPPRPCPFT